MSYKKFFVFLSLSFLALGTICLGKSFYANPKKPKNPILLLVNDTSFHYHWGCFLKTSIVKENFESFGYKIDSIQTPLLYKIKTAPNIIENFNSSLVLNNFQKENPEIIEKIKEAELVVINAEGTLHGVSNQVVSTFYIAYISKVFFNKPVHIINASLFPNDFFLSSDSDEKKFYDFILDKVDSIAFRDAYSFDLFSNFQKKSVLAFDLIPLYIKNYFNPPSIKSFEKKVVLTGSANLILLQERLEEFYQYILYLHQKGYSITFLAGGLSKGAYDDQKMIQFFSEKPPLERFSILVANSPEEWLTALKKSSFILTGRQSVCVAAYSLNTPFICFSSNTPKIEAFCSEVNKEQPIISLENPLFLEKLIEVTETLEKWPDQTRDPDLQKHLTERAKKNFSFLSN
ncbi:MAG: polysaccharide pyruvyl transferase family protein [Chlamydiae bacterium]|jgi:polysaccharide pyruvyl transferase WcaK-like protein|nr:polysaccharide pyruvyl transferase family protein [Chlamydiota bacterium]